MNVTYRIDKDILYIALEGRIDASNASEAEEKIENVIRILENRMKNITIIGMPGSGKSLLARNIAKTSYEKRIKKHMEALNGSDHD